MKLFKSLLVAPATLGLLAPMTASANEVTINDFNAAEEIAVTNSRVDGLEARFNDLEAGSFSETTTASFGVDFLVGAVDQGTSEKTEFAYQMGIGLETSFTGEDSLAATIDIGNASGTSSLSGTSGMNFDG
ncbi:MAG: porin, partial [Prochlorococcus marinus XMU1427]|nr:porin [Prochlorococcus marinus XMU1427]